MGYTHYWYREETLDEETFGRFSNAVKRIIDEVKLRKIGIGDFSGNRKGPEITSELISFNGVEDDSHETCYIERVYSDDFRIDKDGKIFQCCKTARKPYDIAVQTVLISLKHYFPTETLVLSDGDDEEWKEARELSFYLFGYGKDFVLDDIRK